MSSFEEIGALLGFVAFVGLAVLVFLTFQQAKHLRRLREWAGRAPERTAADAEPEPEDAATPAPAAPKPPEPREPLFGDLRESLGERWEEFDRRMPADPRLLLGGLAAILLGVGIATSAFGLLGDDAGRGQNVEAADGSRGQGSGDPKGEKEKKPTVAVLNGTAPDAGVPGVSGIADRVSGDVKSAGFRVGTVDNAGSYASSVVMFESGAEQQARQLAEAMSTLLGTTDVVAITPNVEAIAGGAEIALIIGRDDSTI